MLDGTATAHDRRRRADADATATTACTTSPAELSSGRRAGPARPPRRAGRQCACRCCRRPRPASARRAHRARPVGRGAGTGRWSAAIGGRGAAWPALDRRAGRRWPVDDDPTAGRRRTPRRSRRRRRAGSRLPRCGEVAAAVGPSVVTISVDIEAGVTGEAVGTGPGLSRPDGEILTNAHVVVGRFRDPGPARGGHGADRGRSSSPWDVGNDLALLKINGSKYLIPVAPFAPAGGKWLLGDEVRRHRVRPRPGRRPVRDARHRVGAGSHDHHRGRGRPRRADPDRRRHLVGQLAADRSSTPAAASSASTPPWPAATSPTAATQRRLRHRRPTRSTAVLAALRDAERRRGPRSRASSASSLDERTDGGQGALITEVDGRLAGRRRPGIEAGDVVDLGRRRRRPTASPA